ncbi:putative transcription factor MYB-HB-like family [Helianthus anomalus]
MNQESQMNKTSKKGIITEEDVSTILQRYTAPTVITLLQEVGQVQDAKIDWNSLVKRTKTGITNPREYQMLWRHLAYRDELVEKVEDQDKPLDDDSDLEYELEAYPTVNNEASVEAVACVKVLLASGSTRDSGLEKGLTVEAPLVINIPTSKSTGNLSESQQGGNSIRGTNIAVPVCVQKQPLPSAAAVVATSTEEVDKTNGGSGGGNLPPRRKRKPWSAAEDMELFAAVQKCGEGNWANIIKGDFKGDRTASQLSQRWNIIKKRKNVNPNVRTGAQLSEVHLAARRALNMALDQPVANSLKASSSLGRTKSSIASLTSMRPIIPDAPSGPTALQDHQSGEDTSVLTKTFPKILPKTSPRSLINGPDPVKAAAVAAGARIATPSAAAAILKQQLKSAIHVNKTNISSFRDLHAPKVSRPHDQVGPVVPLNPVSTAAQETNGVTVPISSSPKIAQQDQAAVSQGASEKEVKETAGSRVEPEKESAEQEI